MIWYDLTWYGRIGYDGIRCDTRYNMYEQCSIANGIAWHSNGKRQSNIPTRDPKQCWGMLRVYFSESKFVGSLSKDLWKELIPVQGCTRILLGTCRFSIHRSCIGVHRISVQSFKQTRTLFGELTASLDKDRFSRVQGPYQGTHKISLKGPFLAAHSVSGIL